MAKTTKKDASNLITKAIEVVGLQKLAGGLKKPDGSSVTYQAVRRWEAQGHLPRTEWTGETSYAAQIERMTIEHGGRRHAVTKRQLLQATPQTVGA